MGESGGEWREWEGVRDLEWELKGSRPLCVTIWNDEKLQNV